MGSVCQRGGAPQINVESDDSSISFFRKVSSSFSHPRVLSKSIHQTYGNIGRAIFEHSNSIKALKNKNLQFDQCKALSLGGLRKRKQGGLIDYGQSQYGFVASFGR